MALVFHWHDSEARAEAVRQAIERLEHGGLAAFPGGVAASARSAAAVQQLAESCNGDCLSLALSSAEQAQDYVPGMSVRGQRLARRLWPGPAVLRFGDGWHGGLASQLEPQVVQRVSADGALALAVPEHPALWNALMHLPAPLVLAAPGQDQSAAAVRIEDADHGNGAAAVIRIRGNQHEVEAAGALSPAEVAALDRHTIVFVCTGNTCRSPMAAALCRRQLAERLGCREDELPARGFQVASAGIAALPGEPAAAEAVETVRELGGDLTGHRSQPLSRDLVRQADWLITMTRGHQLMVLARFPQAAVPHTLCPRGGEIADPIGGGPEVYRDCARQILGHLEHWIAELDRPCA